MTEKNFIHNLEEQRVSQMREISCCVPGTSVLVTLSDRRWREEMEVAVSVQVYVMHPSLPLSGFG